MLSYFRSFLVAPSEMENKNSTIENQQDASAMATANDNEQDDSSAANDDTKSVSDSVDNQTQLHSNNETINDSSVRIVMISDTHGRHRDLTLPEGDVLIHAGDFTHFGKRKDADDFNQWLGQIKDQFQHIIVVNGNHECNAMWKKETTNILSNATFLKQERIDIDIKTKCGKLKRKLVVFGTEFSWPLRFGGDDVRHPNYEQIDDDVQILVVHNPPQKTGADGDKNNGTGCPALRARVDELKQLKLIVCGHIHHAHGVYYINSNSNNSNNSNSMQVENKNTQCEDDNHTNNQNSNQNNNNNHNHNHNHNQIVVVNAANARRGHGDMGWPVEVVDI